MKSTMNDDTVVPYCFRCRRDQIWKKICQFEIYRVSQEECSRLRESVPYVKITDITQKTYVQS
jgi:hypothetical protein